MGYNNSEPGDPESSQAVRNVVTTLRLANGDPKVGEWLLLGIFPPWGKGDSPEEVRATLIAEIERKRGLLAAAIEEIRNLPVSDLPKKPALVAN